MSEENNFEGDGKMATEATATTSSTVDEKSENVQSEGKIESHKYSVPITGTQKM